MKLQDTPLATLMPPRAQVELSLAHIEGSAAFRSSRRHRDLLRHLVERTLDGELASLKETVIAVEVFNRSASQFDPKSDTIVRVETRRLRGRLDNYFRAEGRDAALRIELPVGSYVPLIARREPTRQQHETTRRARDLVERGEHFLRQALSQSTLEQALQRFDEALREAPDFVPALVGAGRAWHNLATGWYREPTEAVAHAAEALRRALQLDDSQAEAHALLGAIEHSFERDWARARRSFERALRHGREMAFVHSAYGCHLRLRDEIEASERELLLARQLDPQYVNARMHMINLRIHQGRFADAQAELDAMNDIAPSSMTLAGAAGVLAMARGDGSGALAHYQRALALAPEHLGCQVSVAAALGFAGDVAQADQVMARVMAHVNAQPEPPLLSPYVLAVVASRCGHIDQAFEQLEQSLVCGDPSAIIGPGDPSFTALHADARWPRWVAQVRKPRAAGHR